MQKINMTVLMSGADFFDDGDAINAHMDDSVPVNIEKAVAEHTMIRRAFEHAGIDVIKIDPPKDAQDGVYAANWALISGDKAIMSNYPINARKQKLHMQKKYCALKANR